MDVYGSPRLWRSVLSEEVVGSPLSAASVQASRVAARSRNVFYVATRGAVFQLSVDDLSAGLGTSPITSELCEVSDYIAPTHAPSVIVDVVQSHSLHRAEVASIQSAYNRLASVDSYGEAVISLDDPDGHGKSYILHPGSRSNGEAGWAGISFDPTNPSCSAIARQYYRDVAIYEGDILVHRFHTLADPSGVAHLGESGLLAVLEGNSLSLYDRRANAPVSSVARKAPGSGPLLAVDGSRDGLLAATAGIDRSVHTFDVRTMAFKDRWASCLKYECAGLRFSNFLNGMVYVCGIDNEIACGAWCSATAAKMKPQAESRMMSGANAKSPRRAFGFRADVRLVGLDTYSDDAGEVCVAVSEAGALYLLHCT